MECQPTLALTVLSSDKVSRLGDKALRMQGLYTDSIQNFNTLWQFVSNQDYRTVPPGSEITFEGYIMTPDSNKISGSNTVEIGIWSFNEQDLNFPNIAPIFNKTFMDSLDSVFASPFPW